MMTNIVDSPSSNLKSGRGGIPPYGTEIKTEILHKWIRILILEMKNRIHLPSSSNLKSGRGGIPPERIQECDTQ